MASPSIYAPASHIGWTFICALVITVVIGRSVLQHSYQILDWWQCWQDSVSQQYISETQTTILKHK
ncbi:hypothetical protein PSI19_12810 [Xenorhabdus khoisanae]|uniref:hypothetical protein n=1 Tax=Xenorhabdus khoisanae TaxID=880157 RepID=UPI002359DA5E|nr:hypothetical protein [Xenorhabdus khoisanae]MDC9614728.1 hypothetical protein [Xenorhabdus khoisanae]